MRKLFIAILVFLSSLSICSCSAEHLSVEPSSPTPSATSVLLPVEPVCQYPDFPTGCEVATAVTALNYCGDNILLSDFIDNYLPMNNAFYRNGLLLYGPNPNEVFVGDPRSEASYGCFAPVIKRALEDRLSGIHRVNDLTGQSLDSLCRDYVNKGIPVLLWASSEMRPITNGQTWHFPDGTRFTWPSGEHCLLLIGYDETNYFFCDPHYSHIVAYPRDIVTIRYTELGCQALAIIPFK